MRLATFKQHDLPELGRVQQRRDTRRVDRKGLGLVKHDHFGGLIGLDLDNVGFQSFGSLFATSLCPEVDSLIAASSTTFYTRFAFVPADSGSKYLRSLQPPSCSRFIGTVLGVGGGSHTDGQSHSIVPERGWVGLPQLTVYFGVPAALRENLVIIPCRGGREPRAPMVFGPRHKELRGGAKTSESWPRFRPHDPGVAGSTVLTF